ncbi:MAG: methionyl-tRNA formyltransferase [Chloroflexota bacterium]|nr:methionyl-tRNA formyltransferase [Chloroflexota bacterium]
MMKRALFMGTPAFAVPSLEALAALKEVEITCVVTQPDRPAGRGRTLQPSAVKARALELQLPVWTPENLKAEAEQIKLRELAPDVLVVAAYGEILRPAVLDIPPYGAINVHASLLPRHRGAAPVAGALLSGDEETGVTIMLMDEGMDTGPILARRAIPIREDHTRGTLTEELAQLGADLLTETLPRWLAGEIEPQPQDDEAATYTRLIRKEHGQLDWDRPATELANQVRAFDPWPSTYTTWQGQRLKVLEANVLQERTGLPDDVPPGTVVRAGEAIAAATGDGWLELRRVQLAGKTATDTEEFVKGYQAFVGSVLGE